MTRAQRAWLLLAVGANRQHGGNGGYDDDVANFYRWDSTVPNHAQVLSGDFVILWDKKHMIGSAVVEALEVGNEVKRLFRCANCGKSNIKARTRKVPLYRCFDCFHEFDEPIVRHQEVTTYQASYSASWADSESWVPASDLRQVAIHPRAQNSIREVNRGAFLRLCPHDASRPSAELVAQGIADGHAWRLARTRIGQGEFRKRLLERYGPECAMTGPCPREALEAAHLYSYSSSGRHEDDGGLLLRRDLHRLFDTGLIAVHPTDLKLDLRPELLDFDGYRELHGVALSVNLTDRHRRWLRLHWKQFRQ